MTGSVAGPGFPGKDAIFEALLGQVLLNARLDADTIWQPDGTVALAESARAPDLVRRWHDQVVQKYRAEEQALVDACVRRGVLRDSPLTELFSLSVAPALLWMVGRLILGKDSPYPLEQVRRIHRGMLLDQLQPR